MNSQSNTVRSTKKILAIVGMPGAGKSEVVSYFEKRGIPFVRFGEITDEGLKNQSLEINPDNEREFRENLRKELGMAAYAIKSESKITELLKTHNVIAIDGLRSWEEYSFLKEKFPGLILINIYAEPEIRYERLSTRQVRSVSHQESRDRDVAELVNLHMGGPIAIADYLIINNENNLSALHQDIDRVLNRLGIKV